MEVRCGPNPAGGRRSRGNGLGAVHPNFDVRHNWMGETVSRKSHEEFTCLSHRSFRRIISAEWQTSEAW
jgi:hypothetical protein